MAKQSTAPARLTQVRLVRPNMLSGAELENKSDKPITSYRIGWGEVSPTNILLHPGEPVNAPTGIKPRAQVRLPDQAIPLKQGAQTVIFFVAEVTFADGSSWTVDIKDIAKDAGLDFSNTQR